VIEVTPGDIKLANDIQETVFTAIHLHFFPEGAPFLLSGVDRS
jgi:hypothetical protein